MNKKYIVAEIAKTWANAEYDDGKALLNTQFENVINTNLERGYKLSEWKLGALQYDWTDKNGNETKFIQETIIAVFERI